MVNENNHFQQNAQPQQNAQEQSLDFKVILYKIYHYWYTFILTIFIALTIAFLFNKYTRPVYEASTTVLVKDKSEKDANIQDIIGYGKFNIAQNVENQIAILSSHSLVYQTITNCGFEVSYYTEADFITQELYKMAPFTVVFDSAVAQPVNVRDRKSTRLNSSH